MIMLLRYEFTQTESRGSVGRHDTHLHCGRLTRACSTCSMAALHRSAAEPTAQGQHMGQHISYSTCHHSSHRTHYSTAVTLHMTTSQPLYTHGSFIVTAHTTAKQSQHITDTRGYSDSTTIVALPISTYSHSTAMT